MTTLKEQISWMSLELKSFVLQKTNVKRQPTEWEKIFENLISEKRTCIQNL
jgi:hypothetical protein